MQLHCITQEVSERFSHTEIARKLLCGGAHWIQLRVKQGGAKRCHDIATEILPLCRAASAQLIINDYVEVASAVGANGVHLGVGDEHPSTARKLLGESAIIGATINTRSDIERLQGCRIDYVGIGPFRFTSTKEQLAPILGLDGISEYCSEVRELLPGTLCIAVGGVQFEDLNSLIKTGIHGVAVATAINTANDPVRMTTKFLTALGKV